MKVLGFFENQTFVMGADAKKKKQNIISVCQNIFYSIPHKMTLELV